VTFHPNTKDKIKSPATPKSTNRLSARRRLWSILSSALIFPAVNGNGYAAASRIASRSMSRLPKLLGLMATVTSSSVAGRELLVADTSRARRHPATVLAILRVNWSKTVEKNDQSGRAPLTVDECREQARHCLQEANKVR
jgi:hypothetical protein